MVLTSIAPTFASRNSGAAPKRWGLDLRWPIGGLRSQWSMLQSRWFWERQARSERPGTDTEAERTLERGERHDGTGSQRRNIKCVKLRFYILGKLKLVCSFSSNTALVPSLEPVPHISPPLKNSWQKHTITNLLASKLELLQDAAPRLCPQWSPSHGNYPSFC